MKQLQPPEPNQYGNGYFTNDARVRARDLLWEHLTEDQRAEYVEMGRFTVTGNETGDRYLIRGGAIYRAHDRNDFCLHVVTCEEDQMPFEDQILAQKIIIERDEDLFLRTANFCGRAPLRR
jgi:hypothetical protein